MISIKKSWDLICKLCYHKPMLSLLNRNYSEPKTKVSPLEEVCDDQENGLKYTFLVEFPKQESHRKTVGYGGKPDVVFV